MATLNTRIVIRNDSSVNWLTNKSAVLLKGEIGIEFLADGKVKMKVGDGTKTWEQLPYFGGEEAKVFQVGSLSEITETDLAVGDIAIVKAAIFTDAGNELNNKYSYTSYVYNGSAWAAMDGNYNADNVYFSDDMMVTKEIGYITLTNGQGTIPSKGKNLSEVFEAMFVKEQNPTTTQPSVNLTFSQAGAYEVGTVVSPTYSATFNAGSYTYGPDTGITAQSWEASCTGIEDKKSTASGTFENVVAEATPKKITVKATYNEGAVPKTNLGNPYPEGKITAGTASKDSETLTGVRHMFYGVVRSADFTLDSAHIRSLNHEAANKKTISTFTAGDKALKVVVACPAGYNVTKVTLPSAMGADATADFVRQSGTVQVEGAEGYTAAAYSVWVFEPATIPSSQSYSIVIG